MPRCGSTSWPWPVPLGSRRRGVRWSPSAERDLGRAHEFLRVRSLRLAGSVVARIIKVVDLIEEHPEVCEIAEDLVPHGSLRHFPSPRTGCSTDSPTTRSGSPVSGTPAVTRRICAYPTMPSRRTATKRRRRPAARSCIPKLGATRCQRPSPQTSRPTTSRTAPPLRTPIQQFCLTKLPQPVLPPIAALGQAERRV